MSAIDVNCPECAAVPGERCMTKTGKVAKNYHKARKDAANVKVSPHTPPQPITQTVMNQEPEPAPIDPATIFNHIAFIVDASGSMGSIVPKTREVFNSQLKNVKDNAMSSGQNTLISVFKFGSSVSRMQHHVAPWTVNDFNPRNYNSDMGMTALRDAVGQAVAEFKSLKEVDDVNHSFLIIAITDGQENASRRYSKQAIEQLIRKLQGTDRWTFAFLVPRGDARSIAEVFGAYAGNVTEWDQTNQGVEKAGVAMSTGLDSYYQSRSIGKKSTQSFFADLKHVQDVDLDNLTDLSSNFFRWKVSNDTPIRPFVEEKIRNDRRVASKMNGGFQKGRGFYQLTKSETVQPYKEFAIMEKKTGAVYGGDEARALVGIPTHMGNVKVRPGDFADFELFIMSTSVNRKLIGGTAFLYRHTT